MEQQNKHNKSDQLKFNKNLVKKRRAQWGIDDHTKHPPKTLHFISTE